MAVANRPVRRTVIADAVITVLAERGSRGLTHRAVDEVAGLPGGSTSYYLRSRADLLAAAVARILELDAQMLVHLDTTRTARRALTQLLEQALRGDGRVRSLARYELALEAARQPHLRRQLARGSRRVRNELARVLAAFGVADASTGARDLLVFVDGLLFAQVTGTHGAARPSVELGAALDRYVSTLPRSE